MVELIDVLKEYSLGKLSVRALSGVNLRIEEGEFTAIAGPSGSGKTTLLNLVGCVDIPSKGSVIIDGSPIEKLKDNERTNLRLHKLGFIFQSFNLVSVLNVFQNVEFPLLLQNNLSKGERKEHVEAMVEEMGLSAYMKHRPNELSGGQRQRVAIARALITHPKIVLADEPTANLDSKTGQSILDLMRKMNEESRTTFIFSTHDPRVLEHARRIVTLQDGQIEA